jgi:hypothetical protein
MSADLPEMRHRGPGAMARVLASYIDCPRKVRRLVLSEFDQAPSTSSIRDMRQSILRARSAPDPEPYRPHEGFNPMDASDRAEAASLRFLCALQTAHPERFAP